MRPAPETKRLQTNGHVMSTCLVFTLPAKSSVLGISGNSFQSEWESESQINIEFAQINEGNKPATACELNETTKIIFCKAQNTKTMGSKKWERQSHERRSSIEK
ncbi:hypothetical protein ACE0DR_02540 [Azotobacter sp. CWF10]